MALVTPPLRPLSVGCCMEGVDTFGPGLILCAGPRHTLVCAVRWGALWGPCVSGGRGSGDFCTGSASRGRKGGAQRGVLAVTCGL